MIPTDVSRSAAMLAVCCLVVASPSAGQSPADALASGVDGPAAPVFPKTLSRDGAGRAVVRAIRLTTPLRLDGALDESVYREMEPASDFVQTEPLADVPATE